MLSHTPPTLDPAAARRWAAAAPEPSAQSPGFASPWLHEEVARRMESRLQWLVQKPASWAHWEPVRGGWQAQALVQARYPGAQAYLVETEAARLALLAAAVKRPWWRLGQGATPQPQPGLPGQAVDMVWANMALHHAADPQALLRQWFALLKVDGFLMFSCLGPDTLREIRTLYAVQGWPAPAHEFTDMHDWGDMLVACGFAQPVMDMERISLSFSSPENLLAELRTLGRNLGRARFAGLRTPGWRARLQQVLRAGLADPGQGGRLTLGFEVIYGHAFKSVPRFAVNAETHIDLQGMREAIRGGRRASGQ